MGEVEIRRMTLDDVAAVEALSDEAFFDLDVRNARPGDPVVEHRTPEHSAEWIARARHVLHHDDSGCWVAEHDDALVGFATSIRREGIWILATYAVRPSLQGLGVGRRVLDAARSHAEGCSRGMLSASSDPKAVRRYLLAGFTMHPQMSMRGTVDRSALPAVAGLREGAASDTELLEHLDRGTRGAGHGPDHAHLLATARLLLAGDDGYLYLNERGRVLLLAASHQEAARSLLWTALAEGPAVASLTHLTAANGWAIDIGTSARLDLHQEGYLALLGMAPPLNYVHHGALL